MKPSVRFNETPYRFAHGKAPRGRGSWAFSTRLAPEPFWVQGTYSEARKKARAHYAEKFPRVGSLVVEVLS